MIDQIALKTGTDKSSKWHNYTKYYELFFEPIRNNTLNLLEIGIWTGESLKLWKEYFPKAEIVGVDIEDKSQYNEERITTYIVDQSDKYALTYFVNGPTERFFDIIIDDGSHRSPHQILTFETLFPYLNPGGFFVIEDCLTGYNKDFCKPDEISIIDRIKNMVDEVNMTGKITNLRSDKVESLKTYVGDYFESHIDYLFCSCGLTIIKKL